MANQQLMIQITAQDGATGAFKSIGSSAQQMGTQVEKAGGTSTSAMSRLMAVMKQASVGVGLLSASYVKFAQSAVDNERAMRTLDRTYGETADSLRQYADELQRTTTYSSEQAVEAANLFGTLSRNYGLTSDQIERLITVSADLAAVNGISLADAAERVQAAIRGEGESAEALGLTMNDAATGLATMSAGMTEAEKAAYRYNALLGQAEFATGAAGDQADTTAGKFTQFVNSLEDAGRGFVEMTGPAGQAVAGLATMSSELGMAIGGFAALGPVLKSAANAVGGLTVAMGPVGLALAAGAAILALIGLSQASSTYADGAKAAEEATLKLSESLDNIAISAVAGSQLQKDAEYIGSALETIGGSLSTTTNNALEANLALKDLQQTLGLSGEAYTDEETVLAALSDSQQELVKSTAAWTAAAADQQITGNELEAVLAELAVGYDQLGDGSGAAADAVALVESILGSARDTGVDTAQVFHLVAAALTEFEQTRDFGKLISDLQAIQNGVNAVDLTTAKANQTVLDLQKTMTDSWTAAMDPLAGVNELLANIFSSFAPGAYKAQQAINGVTGAAEILNQQMADAYGNPRAQQQAIDNFYASASAMEILNYELALAGTNQERINQAYADFAVRVQTAGQGIEALDRAISRAWANGTRIWGQMADGNETLNEQRRATEAWGAAWTIAASGWTTLANAQSATNAAVAAGMLATTEQTLLDQAAAAYEAATSVGALDTALEQLAAIGAGQRTEGIGHGIRVHIIDVANEATVAINALETGFQALVQNPINWGKQAQDVADWASSLVAGADGVNSLSDLWGRGQIETETYNAGLTAQGRILDANADIQNDVARIQAKQLPIMADLIEGQAKYMDKLADLDPLNQTIALGYMDTTKAAQAQNLVMLAGAAAAGEYGAMGTEMATNIITAAAEADPVLKAMLQDMGLISEGADGEITVRFDRAKSLNDDLQRLIESIDALVVALGGIPAHTSATVDIAYNINGKPALPGQIGFTMATGGTVYAASQTPMYATAATGRTTLVGEAGPELLTLPVGSQVASAPVTRDRMRSRTMGAGGGVNFYGPVTLAPASTDVEAAIRREALAGSRGY